MKKFFVCALIALSSLGAVSVTEAHHGDGHYYGGGDCYQRENYCGRGYFYNRERNSQNNDDYFYGGGYCYR